MAAPHGTRLLAALAPVLAAEALRVTRPCGGCAAPHGTRLLAALAPVLAAEALRVTRPCGGLRRAAWGRIIEGIVSLAAGARLGPYEVVAPLGSGGMGEVYRARDTRLRRDVALKVLPASLAGDEERLRRFELEARAAGSLNHPNVVSVYDVGREDGRHYVVSELLEGHTLRERLRDALPPAPKALDWALQLARGLSAAHERGVVHRDLKPENVFVTRDGHVKVLDFGLAKLALPEDVPAPASGESEPTLTRGTGPGVVLGTVGYMSPEQVRGQPADHRSDIFAFGAVLYEMLSGQRAFHGDSAVETMTAILKEEPPDLEASGRTLPPGLGRVARHCLEKVPGERFQSARDLVFDLETVSGTALGGSGAARLARAAGGHPALARAASWSAALLLALLVGAVLGARFVPVERPAAQPTFHQVSFQRGKVSAARFAADGATLVYSAAWDDARSDAFVARLDSPDARPLGVPHARVAGLSGGELALLRRENDAVRLVRLPLLGGAPRAIAEDVEAADWGAGEFAVARFVGGRVTLEFPLGQPVASVAGRVASPRVSPDGRHVAYVSHPLFGDDRGGVVVLDRAGRRVAASEDWGSVEGLAWAPGGRAVWFTAARQGSRSELHALSLDGRVRPVYAAPGRLMLHDLAADGRALLSLDNVRGEVVALAPGASAERHLEWHDFSFLADLSADGRQVLFSESGESGGRDYGVYLRGTDGAPAVRLGSGRPFALSPDGRWALTVPLDPPPRIVLLPTGPGQPRTLPLDGLGSCQWAGFFPDGTRLVLLGDEPGRPPRLWSLDLASGARALLVPGDVPASHVTFAPDGRRFLAVDGSGELPSVRLFETGGAELPRPAGLAPGDSPVQWHADGRRLYVAASTQTFPLRLFTLDLVTGRRTPWREITPADPAGAGAVRFGCITPDGSAYAYTLRRTLSNLFVVEGLK